MKHVFSLTVLVMTVAAVTLGSSGQSLAAEPTWWHDECEQALNCGYWIDGTLQPDPDCGPVAPPGGKDRAVGDIAVAVFGETVFVSVENAYVWYNVKSINIRVEGHNATGDPADFAIDTLPPGLISETTINELGYDPGNGNWWVDVSATVVPQPDEVMIQFAVPGITQNVVDDVDFVWAWECCVTDPLIPAVSEWGLLVMVLLGLAAGTIMFRRARAVAA